MKKLILGSSSPRRKELMETLGYSFIIRTKDTDESFPISMQSCEVATFVAEKKANALIPELGADEILLCADTIVVVNDEILGKPLDRSDAINMLGKLAGRSHDVITGVFIYTSGMRHSFSVTTTVHFNPLTVDEISFYVDRFQPFDKAGSYGIQDWIGCAAIERIEGSYTNVVGLPTREVYAFLKELDIKKADN